MAHFHIADDHPLFRAALTTAIQNNFIGATITESGDLDSTLQMVEENPAIDLLLLDLNMPGSHDLYGLISIREKYPSIPVVVISATDDRETISLAINYGASGYIPKSIAPTQLFDAIKKIYDGGKWLPSDFVLNEESSLDQSLVSKIASLTPQQYRVLSLIREGWLNKQIGYELGVTEATIKAHVTAILRKLGATNRTQAVMMLSKIYPD